jgi:PAS domain S-box-containing protein
MMAGSLQNAYNEFTKTPLIGHWERTLKPKKSLDPANPVAKASRILLLLADPETRALLRQWLARDYHLEVPEQAVPEPPAFDLAILDSPHLKRPEGGLGERKRFEQPVFLPVLLIASPGDPILRGPHIPEGVDEIILAPLNKFELRVRVANLLHTRHLSRALEGYREHPPGRVAAGPGELARANEEQVLKAKLLDLVTEPIYVSNFEGNFILVNEAACQSRGYSRKELMELNLQQLITPENARSWPQKLKELQDKGELYFESRSFCKDGSILPLEIHARVIDLQGLKVILSVARDTSERERSAEIQAKMAAKLRQVAKMEALGTFASGIAHEFNNVLGAMIGYVELACMTLETIPGAGKISSKLEASLRAGDRARDLVNQILSFSRQNEREPRPLEILPIVKESLKLLRASLPATIEIRQNLDPQCGLVVADPVQVSQILINLSSNAFEAMRETGGVLQISLEPVRLEAGPAEPGVELKSGPYLRLTVKDSGRGMDQTTLERIFDPLFITKPVGERAGLGLSAVHGIVQSLGGAIGVSSEPGKGSAFRVYLPSHQGPSAPEVPINGPLPRGTEHILLVDDEAAIVQIGKEFLQGLGYRVTAFNSGPEAWEEFQAHPQAFDLLITDLTMPAMTGLDLAEAALKLRPDLLVLLNTGHSEADINDKVRKIGNLQCLVKPLALTHLAWTVRWQLDRKA